MIHKTGIAALLGAISILLLLLIIGFNSFLEQGVRRSPLKALNNEITDIAFQNRVYSNQDSLLSSDDIVIVDIDDESIKTLGRVQLWPRLYEAKVINYLSTSGARAVLLDALYTEPDTLPGIYRNLLESAGYKQPAAILTSLSSDSVLAQSIRNAGNVYLTLFDDESIPAHDDVLQLLERHAQVFSAKPGDVSRYIQLTNITLPIPLLAEAAKNIGAINLPSTSDGVIRFYPVLQKLPHATALPQKLIGNFTFQYLADNISRGNPDCINISAEEINLCNTKFIPVRPDGSFRLNWLGTDESFRTISFHKVLNEQVPGPFFKDKIVFIGTSAAGLQDNKTTPLAQKLPGVQVHATALLNMVNKSYLTEPALFTLLPVFFLISFVLSTFFIALKPIYSFLVFIVIALLELFTYWLVVFDSFALILPVGTVISLTLITFITGVIYRYITEEKQKKMLKGAFSSYVESEVVDLILENRHSLELGGEKKELTVLFSDIRGFTSFSEKMDPQQLVSFLNQYLDQMSEIIFSHKGTIDKFIGDAIMAIYGAPIHQPNNATRACLTALDMLEALHHINSNYQIESSQTLTIGIGINTGPMTVGNIGSKKRFDYTVIGDAVNLAARLEGLNKYFGTHILISAETLKQTDRTRIHVREIATVAVKGKNMAVPVYELISPRLASSIRYSTFLGFYNDGLQAYYKRNFEHALNNFEKALSIENSDQPTRIYIERCQAFMESPEQFSPVFKMEIK